MFQLAGLHKNSVFECLQTSAVVAFQKKKKCLTSPKALRVPTVRWNDDQNTCKQLSSRPLGPCGQVPAVGHPGGLLVASSALAARPAPRCRSCKLPALCFGSTCQTLLSSVLSLPEQGPQFTQQKQLPPCTRDLYRPSHLKTKLTSRKQKTKV